MIALTRLNKTSFLLNDDLIEIVEATPDTVIRLTTGDTYVVRESPEKIVALIVAFRSRCSRGGGPIGSAEGSEPGTDAAS